jgi:hypothetical protein
VCKRRIRWLRDATTGTWVKFAPDPVSPSSGRLAHPTEGNRFWFFPALVEDLMARRSCNRDDAQDAAYDMAWYSRHVCPPSTGVDDEEGR